MNLKDKLSLNSTLLFALTIGLVMSGSFFLFKNHMKDLYYESLEENAMITALFYFEKDEITKTDNLRYQEIKKQYRKISDESVRVYDAKTLKIFINDGLNINLSSEDLKSIIKNKNLSFTKNDRQFVGIFYQDNEGDFIIIASGIDHDGNQQLSALALMFIIFYLAGIPINYFLGTFLAKKTFSPFEQVISKVNSITTENLHSRLEIADRKQTDEIGELVSTFNYLLERLENGVMMQQNFIKHASHELKTPLTILAGHIDVSLQQPRTTEEYEKVLELLKKDTKHLKSILEGLLVLSGLEVSGIQEKEIIRIDEIIWNILEKKAVEYPNSKIIFDLTNIAENEDLLTITAEKHLLFTAINNIVDNAVKYSFPERVTVEALNVNNNLVIKIKDLGPGISDVDKEAIFDPFFRGENTRHIQGQGLGLYITMQILKRQNITLTLESEIEKGTTISLFFQQQS